MIITSLLNCAVHYFSGCIPGISVFQLRQTGVSVEQEHTVLRTEQDYSQLNYRQNRIYKGPFLSGLAQVSREFIYSFGQECLHKSDLACASQGKSPLDSIRYEYLLRISIQNNN